MKINCKTNLLVELQNIKIDDYKNFVHPIDYEFDIIRNRSYSVLGFLTWDNTAWVYIISSTWPIEIQLVPAVLFDFHWTALPESWYIRINENPDHNIEILPKKLTEIEHWFEKYTDEDPEVLNTLKSVILDLDKATTTR